MIENLARRGDDDLAVLIRQRLPRASDVDDSQPDVRQANSTAGIESVTIGSPVSDRGRHSSKRLGGDAGRRLTRDSGYAAHMTISVEGIPRANANCLRASP